MFRKHQHGKKDAISNQLYKTYILLKIWQNLSKLSMHNMFSSHFPHSHQDILVGFCILNAISQMIKIIKICWSRKIPGIGLEILTDFTAHKPTQEEPWPCKSAELCKIFTSSWHPFKDYTGKCYTPERCSVPELPEMYQSLSHTKVLYCCKISHVRWWILSLQWSKVVVMNNIFPKEISEMKKNQHQIMRHLKKRQDKRKNTVKGKDLLKAELQAIHWWQLQQPLDSVPA